MSRENTDLSMVPYRATIARAMLDVLPKEGDTRPSPAEFRPLQAVPAEDSSCKVPVLPLNNGDDVLCAELLRVVSLVSVLMLIAICLQPVPFLVGPTTLSYGWRVALWLVSVGALLVTFSLFHRTCYEQHRFRKLVHQLQELIPNPDLGVSNRQLALVLAKASEPVTNLTIVPCALVFLIYASHLHPLGGVPMAGELSALLGFSLLTMLYSYTRLRGAAMATRAAVLDAYRKEQADASRLMARLKSYADGPQPLQDDQASLVEGLQQLIRGSSTTPTYGLQEIEERIKDQPFRRGLCGYLNSVIRRDRTFVQQLGEIRGGVLAPLLTNPITAALMIPIGGASALTAIEWIVSNAR